ADPERGSSPARSRGVCPLLQSREATPGHRAAATAGGTGSLSQRSGGNRCPSGIGWPAPRLSTDRLTHLSVRRYRRILLVAKTGDAGVGRDDRGARPLRVAHVILVLGLRAPFR